MFNKLKTKDLNCILNFEPSIVLGGGGHGFNNRESKLPEDACIIHVISQILVNKKKILKDIFLSWTMNFPWPKYILGVTVWTI